jgi:hypothetical protein
MRSITTAAASLMVLASAQRVGAELDPAPAPPALSPPAPAASALTEGQVADLGVVAGLMAMAVLAEAAAGVIQTVGVAEAGALSAGIGQALAQGGVAGTVAAVSITTVTVATVAISLLALGIIVIVVAPTLAASLRANHSQRGPSITTGEQTDDMHQAIQAAANAAGSITINFGGRGGDLDVSDLDATVDAAIAAGLDTGPLNAPGTALTVDLNPVDTSNPGESGPPSGPPSDSASADVGLFMVIDERPGAFLVEAGGSVASPAALWLLIGAGAVRWAIRRRAV